MAKRKPSDINLIVAVDKPIGCTSHDVVGRVRRAVGERRVGHAGTLDPLATGVMIIGIGQATRLLGRITLDRKSYLAAISFGCETNTDDAEGEATRVVEPHARLLDEAYAREVLSEFIGSSEQVPPAFSAISVDGVRAYKRARSGDDVDLPARPIEVLAADLVSVGEGPDGAPEWTVAFTVSKGTYIRALARDIGRSAGGAAHVSMLRRTASGSVTIGSCIDVERIDVESARSAALDPCAVLDIQPVAIDDGVLGDVLLGRSVALPCVSSDRVGLVNGGSLRAIAARADGRFKMEMVFPQGIEGVRS